MLRRTCALATAALISSVLATMDAEAAAQRTFVASYGSPTNTSFNCSITKPCRAFSEAIGVTNPKGEVVVLDSAGYGPVTITQSVSIIAPSGIYAGISVFSGDGVTVSAGASDVVVLRGLSINSQGGRRGILFLAGARLRVENCVVSGMGIDGIAHFANNGEMIVLDTIVRDNGNDGIAVNGDLPSAVLDHVRSEHNGFDGFNISPTTGSLGTRATIANSVFAHNGLRGIGANTSGGTITIVVEGSVIASNGTDGFAATVAGGFVAATIARNTVNDNGGNGIWLHGNVSALVSENAAHRNSGDGIFSDGADPVYIYANTSLNNLSWDLECNSSSGSMRSPGNNIAPNQRMTPAGCVNSNPNVGI